MKKIVTDEAPEPAGHYSQGVVHGDLVFVSGQLPIVPGSDSKVVGSIEEQTEQVLKNVSAVLEAAGSDLSKVLKVTVYISDISLWSRVNAVYEKFFGEYRPARAVVPTRDLHFGYQIEIDAVAIVE